jgi:DUF4097 and DUF4098 domain-containing protein YvlB
MHLHGDQLAPNQVVTVNGKQVLADVRELDTKEGYVDIELPVLEQVNTISKDGNVQEENVPFYDVEIKRLTGEIKIITLE